MSVRARLLSASLVALSVLAPAGVLGRRAVAPVLRIQPLLGPRVHITSGHQPPTTQQCEQTTKTACYSPASSIAEKLGITTHDLDTDELVCRIPPEPGGQERKAVSACRRAELRL